MNTPEVYAGSDRKLEELVDKRGVSYAEARAHLATTETDAQSEVVAPVVSEVRTNWNVRFISKSPEQAEINRRGISLVRKMGELVMSEEYQALNEETRTAMRDALIARHNSSQQ